MSAPEPADGPRGEPHNDHERARVKAAVLRRLLPSVQDVESPKIGRFSVLREVGRGGMGVVYAVYDEELDRRVALKLIRGEAAAEHKARFRREAQAMAQLTHPNVVPVFEVGEHEGESFIVMEYVKGQTLRQWASEGKRRAADVLDKYVQVGRGLAAAHAIGLVHRDFKPDNAVVGDSGRVRVLDFGLARKDHEAWEITQPVTVLPTPRDDAFSTPLTQTGAAMGTPAYMAPEQLLGELVDARTDQFAFCVALWEALCGERPFAGTSKMELVSNVTANKLRQPPRDATMPRWVRPVLERGLVVDPAKRWPSMDALLRGLVKHQRRRKRRRVLAGVGLATLAVGGIVGAERIAHHRAVLRCENDGAAIENVWNDDQRTALRSGLLASGADATATAEKIMPWLDRQAEVWREARTEACLDTEVREVWDSDMRERSAWCLEERSLEMGALVRQLQEADVRAVMSAVPAAAGLQPVASCRDPRLLSRLPMPSREQRQVVQALRKRLAGVKATASAGAFRTALPAAQELLIDVEAVSWPPLLASARLEVGSLLEATGAYTEAETMLESAYFAGAQMGAPQVALAAAQTLTFVVGDRLARRADGRRWYEHAEVLRAQLPDIDSLHEAGNLNNLGAVMSAAGNYDEAAERYERALAVSEDALGADHPTLAATLSNLAIVREATGAYDDAARLHERALAIRRKALGADHPEVAMSLGNLANVRYAQGAYEDAAALSERALTVWRKTLGPDHPNVAASLTGLGNVKSATGAYEDAAALHGDALAIWERALGPDHPKVAMSLSNLGNAHHETGSYEDAAKEYARALAIWEKALGPDHPDVATGLNNLANTYGAMGAYEDGIELHARALAITEKALGPDHPDVAESLVNLALLHHQSGSYDEATKLLERALAIFEKALTHDHPLLAHPLIGLALLALEQGRPAEALPLAERAVRLREATKVPPAGLAEARFVLARALWSSPEATARPRAVSLAERARDAYRKSGEANAEELGEVQQWLREHNDGN